MGRAFRAMGAIGQDARLSGRLMVFGRFLKGRGDGVSAASRVNKCILAEVGF